MGSPPDPICKTKAGFVYRKDDFVRDTAELSNAAKFVYLNVCAGMWEAGGWILDKPKVVQKACTISIRDWSHFRYALLPFLIETTGSDGKTYLGQKRVHRDLTKLLKWRDDKAESRLDKAQQKLPIPEEKVTNIERNVHLPPSSLPSSAILSLSLPSHKEPLTESQTNSESGYVRTSNADDDEKGGEADTVAVTVHADARRHDNAQPEAGTTVPDQEPAPAAPQQSSLDQTLESIFGKTKTLAEKDGGSIIGAPNAATVDEQETPQRSVSWSLAWNFHRKELTPSATATAVVKPLARVMRITPDYSTSSQRDGYACQQIVDKGLLGWDTVIAAEDMTHPNHVGAVTQMLAASKQLEVGWISPEKRAERSAVANGGGGVTVDVP